MATSTITNTVTNPSGTALAAVPIIIRLVPRGGFRVSDASEVTPTVTTVTNASGVWSVALERNSNISPANSYYEVEEQCSAAQGGPRHYLFQVGSGNQTLYAALISAIPDITSSNYLTQASADARYQQLNGYGVTGDITASRPADVAAAGVLTTAARSDHKHSRETIYGTAAQRAALSGVDLYNGLRFVESDTSLVYTRIGGAWVLTNTLGAWIAFTPTVKFGATAATIAADCRYSRHGRLIIAHYAWRLTNLNGGAGTLTITRPVAGYYEPVTPNVGNAYSQTMGTCSLIDVSAGGLYHYGVSANLSDGSDIVFRSNASPGVVVSNTSPFTVAVGAIATGDEFYANIIYEAAA